MKSVSTPHAPPAIGPYSQAVVDDHRVFTSGQIPLTSDGRLIEGGIEAQTEQVFDNLAAVLVACGASLSHVAKVTVFMTDLQEFDAMNAVYARRFGSHRPARSTVQVSALPRGVRIEIEATARVAP